MPTASAAIPIMLGFPSACSPSRSVSAGVLSLVPNLLGDPDIPERAGRQRQTVGDVDGDADTVGDLQQPKTLQAGAVVEDVAHRVRRTARGDDIGAAGRVVVDQDCGAG